MRILIFILGLLVLSSCAGRRTWDLPTQSRWIIVQAKSLGLTPAGCGRYQLLEPYGRYYTGQVKVRSYDDCSRDRISCPFGARANLLLEEMKGGDFWLRRVECFE